MVNFNLAECLTTLWVLMHKQHICRITDIATLFKYTTTPRSTESNGLLN